MTTQNAAKTESPILVIGSTGKTGRRVRARLQAQGMLVRAGSRQASVPFDWEDPSTWAPALDGVRKAYVAYHPDLAVPGAPKTIQAFVRAAVDAGLEHLVLLSGRGEDEARRCERIVEDSGLTWTVVRASWFFQNFSEGFLRDLVVAGTVALPAAGVLEPFVDAEDIADVVVAALTETGLENQLVEITGPRLMTFAQAVSEIAEATGQDISYSEISHPDFLASLRQAEVPEGYVGLLDYLFRTVLDGRNASITDGVLDALGRPPRDFQIYAERTAATGEWSSRSVA